MPQTIFTSKQAQEIIDYVHQEYGDELEFLWQKFPKDAIWRNQTNRKWYALLMTIPRSKLPNQTSNEEVEIIDLRFHKNEALDFAAASDHVFPGYHMNKNNWITIILDGSMPTPEILNLLDQSYHISLSN